VAMNILLNKVKIIIIFANMFFLFFLHFIQWTMLLIRKYFLMNQKDITLKEKMILMKKEIFFLHNLICFVFPDSVYAMYLINWLYMIWLCSCKIYLLLIKTFFIFNIHLCLINEYRIKMKSLKEKWFTKKIIKWL